MKYDKTAHPIKNTVFFLLLAFLAFIYFIGHYMNQLNTTFADETSRYLQEIANQSVGTLQKQLLGELNTLEDLSQFIGQTETIDVQKIIPLLDKVRENNGFKRMNLIFADGWAYTTDHEKIYIKDRKYFRLAMHGQSSISDTFPDKVGGEKINVFTVPIYHRDEIIGLLSAVRQEATYQQVLSVSTFHNRGYSYIVKSNGDTVVGSTHPQSISANNIFSLLKKDASLQKQTLQQMKKDMLVDKNGFLRFVVQGQDNYMSYVPIHINDWYLLSIIPRDIITQKISYIMNYTFIISFSVIVIFVILLGYILWIQKKNKEALEKLAFIDPVTGAKNLNHFREVAKTLLLKNTNLQYALVQIDIDKFKYINQSFGYLVGDRILLAMAMLLQEKVGEKECFAHTGSDCFVLLLAYSKVEELEERLRQWLAESKHLTYRIMSNYHLVISMGVCQIVDATTPINMLIDNANLAKRTIKGNYESSFAFYDQTIRETLNQEKEIENTMNIALQQQEFEVYYQPKYQVKTTRICGAEALIRWNHPKNGLMLPDRFIPLFERNGFIIQLDFYVFEQVCKKMRQWLDEGALLMKISINFSRVHLQNISFPEMLEAVIEKYHIPANLLELEITESAVFQNKQLLLELIDKLHKIGFLISMDDFGSGYSSLNMLKEIPVDILKLDREFFKETDHYLRDREIIKTLVALAQNMGIKVVAEGVETADQLNFLQHICCDYAQGYYFSKPLPVAQFEKLW